MSTNSSVVLRFIAQGQSTVTGIFDNLKKQRQDLEKGVSIPVDADDKKATTKLDDVNRMLADLNKKQATASADVNDSLAKAKLLQIDLTLKRLNDYTAKPTVSVTGLAKAEISLLKIDAELDKINSKNVNPGGSSSGLAPGAASAASAASGGGSAVGGLAAIGSTLLPALTPVVIGAGTALGGVFAAAFVNKGFKKTLAAQAPLFKSIMATATTPIVKAVDAMLPQIDRFAKSMGPELKQAFAASTPFLSMMVNLLEYAAKTILPVFTQAMVQMTPYIPQMTKAFEMLVLGAAQFIQVLGPLMGPSVQLFLGFAKGIQVALNVLGVAVDVLTGFFRVDFAGMTAVVKIFSGLFTGNMTAVRNAADGFGREVSKVFHDVMVAVNTALKNIGLAGFAHNVSSTFDTVRHTVANAGDAVVNSVRNAFNNVVSYARGLPGRVKSAIGNVGSLLSADGRNMINGLFSGMKAVISGVKNWVKSNLYQPIVGAVKSLFGIKSPSTIMAGLGKHITAGLFKGILHNNPRQFITKIFGGLPDALGALLGKGLLNVEKLPAKALKALGSLGSKLGGFFSSIFGSSGGSGVARWAGVVAEALALNGLPQSLSAQVLHQISTESGGNPNAINLTDSNAAAGDPSRGLLQTIGSTFAAFHVGGTSSNIYDPLANVAAAINYAKHTYGPGLMSGGNGLGSGHGYALGTLSATKGWHMVGERGPELMGFRGGESVIPNSGIGTTVVNNYIVNAKGVLSSQAEIGRYLSETIKKSQRHGSK